MKRKKASMKEAPPVTNITGWASFVFGLLVRKNLKKVIRVTPPVLIFVDGSIFIWVYSGITWSENIVWAHHTLFGANIFPVGNAVSLVLYSGYAWAEDILWLHREVFGHGLFLVSYMVYFSYRFRVCRFTWLSVSALAAINILNLSYYFLSLNYRKTYMVILAVYIVLMLSAYAFQPDTNNPKGGIV